jgi:hypothetical protein
VSASEKDVSRAVRDEAGDCSARTRALVARHFLRNLCGTRVRSGGIREGDSMEGRLKRTVLEREKKAVFIAVLERRERARREVDDGSSLKVCRSQGVGGVGERMNWKFGG